MYLNNLFTYVLSLNLIKSPKQRSYHGKSTIRENLIPKDFPLPNKATVSKIERGTSTAVLEKKDGIQILEWIDKNVVPVESPDRLIINHLGGYLFLSVIKVYQNLKLEKFSRPKT